MYLFLMPPPPSNEQCFIVAGIFGLLAFAVSCMAFKRLRSRPDPAASAKWIAIGALGGGMAAALAGPIALRTDAMPHWIGYNAQDTIVRSFLGTLAGIVVASLVIRWIGASKRSKPRLTVFQFRISALLLLTAFVGLLCAIFALSAYVGFFVLLQLFVMVAAFAAYVHSALARTSTDMEHQVDSSTSESAEMVGKAAPQDGP